MADITTVEFSLLIVLIISFSEISSNALVGSSKIIKSAFL